MHYDLECIVTDNVGPVKFPRSVAADNVGPEHTRHNECIDTDNVGPVHLCMTAQTSVAADNVGPEHTLYNYLILLNL